MNINDYIKDATSKIFDTKEKHKVEAELNDHMFKHKEFYEEIGYDAETAEEMAVEKMGDGIEIAEQLGTLHNDFYTPAPDIIAAVIWLAILGGVYYLLNKYIFDDIACVPLTFSAIGISSAIYFTAGFAMLKRNRLHVTISNILGAIGTGAFIFLCIRNVNRLVSGSFDKLKDLIFNHQICYTESEKSKVLIMISVAAFAALALFSVLTSLIYYIKHSTNNNSLFDNHFKTFASRLTIIFAAGCIIISGLFAYNYFCTKNYLKNDYYGYYNQVLDIAESCKTFDEVYEYVGRLDDEYTAYVDKNGIVQRLSYTKNFANIEIERQEDGSYNDSVVSNYGFVDDGSILDDTFYNDYTIYFSLNYKKYYNDYNAASIKQMLTNENELDEITRFDMDEHSINESFDFFSNYAPNSLTCKPSQNDKYPGVFEWTFITGDKYKYTRQFYVRDYPQYYLDVKKRQNEIAEIIKANPNADFEEIARLTDTELIPYHISYDDYKRSVNLLGNYFDSVKEDMLAQYNELSRFKVSDDLYFTLNNQPYEYVYFNSDKKLEYINIIFIGNKKYQSSDYGNNSLFKKVNVISEGYYAKNGLCYSYDTVPYFEKDGTRYTIYTENEDPGDKSGYIKHYYLINKKGEKYEHDICYIDSEGYLFFDKRHILKADADGLTYKDSNSNTYTRAFETSWDENGNLIDFEEYLPTNN